MPERPTISIHSRILTNKSPLPGQQSESHKNAVGQKLAENEDKKAEANCANCDPFSLNCVRSVGGACKRKCEFLLRSGCFVSFSL
jgi:hypothetical protein